MHWLFEKKMGEKKGVNKKHVRMRVCVKVKCVVDFVVMRDEAQCVYHLGGVDLRFFY